MTNGRPLAWQTAVASVRGATHRRHQQPNQDAVAQQAATSLYPWSIIAVADGHGSAACPRSRNGARMAVRCAVAALHSFALQFRYSSAMAEAFLAAGWSETLIRSWREAVAVHHQRAPLPGYECDTPWLAYGTTLLAAIALPRMLLMMQIGDGDMLAAGTDGVVPVMPPGDEIVVGEETASLCLPDARRWMRTAILPVEECGPDLILLATDGYAKSFASREDFLQVAGDLRASRERCSWPALRRALPGWLRETTEAGSGDDISVGILSRS